MNGTKSTEPALGPGAWYTLLVLTLVYTCHNIDRSVLSILLEPIKKEFTLTDSQLGLLTGLPFSFFYAAAGIPVGYLIDRVNRRNLLAVLVITWSAFTAACGLSHSFWHLLITRLGVGMAESGGSPTAMSMLADIFPPKRRSFAVGVFWMSTSFGSAIALAAGGYLATHYGWRTAFFVAGLPGVILVALLFFTTREPRRGAMDPALAGSEKPPTYAETWRYASRSKMFVCAFIGMTCNSIVGAAMAAWEASFLVRSHGLSMIHAGVAVAVVVVGLGATSTFLGGLIADRLAVRRGLRGAALVPLASAVLAALAMLVMVLAPTPATAIAGLAFWGATFRLYFGPGNNLMLSSVLPRMRGVAGSWAQAAAGLFGWGIGPTLVGVVSDATVDKVGVRNSLQWGLSTMILFGLISALAFFLASRARTPEEIAAGRAGA